MSTEYSVKIRVFKGKKSYDENHKLLSANQLVTLTPFNGFDWINFMKHAMNLGHTSAEVVQVQKIVYTSVEDKIRKDAPNKIVTTYEDVETPQEITDAVHAAFNPVVKTNLTPEQVELADLKAEMAEMKASMSGGKKAESPKKDNTPNVNEELEVARARYTELYGKKPHHMTQLPKLNELIAAKENA